MAQILVADLASRIPCGTKNHIVERHSHREEFVHHVEHVLHSGVHAADVEIGGNGIGQESLSHGGHGNPPGKAPSSMADVENHSTLSPFPHTRVHAARLVQFVAKP